MFLKRGLNRKEALFYTGLSSTVFDEEIAAKRLPQGKKIGPHGSVLYDKVKIDAALDGILSGSVNIDREFFG